MVVTKALAQVLSNGDSLALQVGDEIIGVVWVIQVCKLTGNQAIDLQEHHSTSATCGVPGPCIGLNTRHCFTTLPVSNVTSHAAVGFANP